MNDISLADQMFDISNAAFEKIVDKYCKKYIKWIEKCIIKNCKKGLFYVSIDRNTFPINYRDAIEVHLAKYFEDKGFIFYINLFSDIIRWNERSNKTN